MNTLLSTTRFLTRALPSTALVRSPASCLSNSFPHNLELQRPPASIKPAYFENLTKTLRFFNCMAQRQCLRFSPSQPGFAFQLCSDIFNCFCRWTLNQTVLVLMQGILQMQLAAKASAKYCKKQLAFQTSHLLHFGSILNGKIPIVAVKQTFLFHNHQLKNVITKCTLKKNLARI